MVAIVGDIQGSLLSPENRARFSANEKTVIAAFEEGLVGQSNEFFDEWVRENYIQHAVGVAQGREGIREMARQKYGAANTMTEFIPIHLISEGDFVVLHRLMRRLDEDGAVVEVGSGVDIFRLDAHHRLAEHWHVLEPQALDYDPNAYTDGG